MALALVTIWPVAAQMPGGPPEGAGQSPVIGANPAMIRLDARLTQLEADLRSVTGRVDDLGFEIRKLDKKLEKLSADLEYRLNELKPTASGGPATGGASAVAEPPATRETDPVAPKVLGRAPGEQSDSRPAAVPPPAGPAGASPPAAAGQSPAMASPSTPSPPAPDASPPSGQATTVSPQQQYAQAFQLMQKTSYAEAASAFTEFLKRHPNDPLADNARYWLGESYYARGDYTRAAEAFLDAYEKGRSAAKGPDSLLKLGLSLDKLDKKKEACATYREMARVYPNVAASVRDRAAQESKRLGCS